MNVQKQAFTLVELIVVVTILAILSTIGFVSYSSYLTWVRDTNRVSNMKAISDWLELYRTKFSLPLPEDSVEVKANGEVISYQWYAWANVLESIEFSNWWKDPKNDTYYSYYLTKDKKYFQLMWFLEEEGNLQTNIFNKIGAVDYSILIPTVYGKKLGILTDELNTPVQEISSIATAWKIELDTTNSWTVYNMHLKDGETYTFLWRVLNHKLYTISKPGKYWPPKECEDWFIASWWDSAFNQLWFCVSAYEMSYDELGVSDSASSTWNTRAYSWSKTPVSMPNRLPVTELHYPSLVEQCDKIWAHVMTNNEYMTIARQIEFNHDNWSNGEIWDWYIPNWVSNETANGHWCAWQQDWTAYAWITWSDCDWTYKNRLKLFNWQEIFDFAWNASEIVNWTNNLNSDWAVATWNACWTNAWHSWAWTDLWWIGECVFQNGYTRESHWPLLEYNADNGMGRIYSYTATDRFFVRGLNGVDAISTGIYSLGLDWWASYGNALGFRCIY